MWYHAPTRSWEVLDPSMPQRAAEVVNLPLRVIEPTHYEQFAVKLARGDLVLIYTDALVEAMNAAGRLLGEQGLLDLVRRMNVDEPHLLNQRLRAAVAKYRGGAAAADDETLLVLHHNAADPPKQTLGEKMHVMAKMLGLAVY